MIATVRPNRPPVKIRRSSGTEHRRRRVIGRVQLALYLQSTVYSNPVSVAEGRWTAGILLVRVESYSMGSV
jgi:hypothetical protein